MNIHLLKSIAVTVQVKWDDILSLALFLKHDPNGHINVNAQ